VKVRGIDAVYYVVKDIGVQQKFYTTLLGAEPDMTWPDQLAEWTFADGNSFGLYRTGDPPEQRSGSALFAVDDVVAAVADAKASGATFYDDGAITDIPSCHMAFGEDPEGNQFILHKRK
jgi:predicted enzyme related to lactoylglutathione lyase